MSRREEFEAWLLLSGFRVSKIEEQVVSGILRRLRPAYKIPWLVRMDKKGYLTVSIGGVFSPIKISGVSYHGGVFYFKHAWRYKTAKKFIAKQIANGYRLL